ncbi:hypothetical protein EFK50_15770 [Nocardioides marmoriginsengisoli]|uniref:Uncharacterized protein n=1 Tax=Nocardioides marmoriginsengisoli TaxID=661483 RepID=A0A3N0CIR2_9ACTN|nr:hypothetical protein [Nocardioides marmoriginsengisoli]RNL63161.1 hypothetical protein EFK50_15770 [Nocardioides marmoriginsengisoli]
MDVPSLRPALRLAQRPRPARSLGSTVLRVLVPRALVFATLSGVLLVGSAMAVSPSSAPAEALPRVAPTWSVADRAAQPDCVPTASWPEGRLGSAVVVHRFSDDATVRLPFLEAWRTNHNESEADDLWVLGVCP